VYRMPRSACRASCAAVAAPGCRALVALLAGSLAVLVSAAVAGCGGGSIAASTPASTGQSFVSGSYSTTFFRPGSRPEAPPVSGTTLTGRQLSLRSYRGDVVVLNFWGSWCAPCRQEAPALAALARHFQSGHVGFVGVDIRDSQASAEAFARTFGVGYPSLNDPGDEIALQFRSTLPPAGIPSTLVLDRSGHIAGRIVGGVSYSGLKALISTVAAENS
jgi:thiol-disulfide isomerase/thioredoxin